MTARSALLARHGGVLAVCALVQAVLGWVATEAYLVANNNLAANGNWVVSKTELDKGLMGAYSFLSGRQSLAGGGLHLDAWHGFQEVVTTRSFAAPRSIEFDAVLARGAWLAVSFNRGGAEPYAAVRLSRNGRLPSTFLTVDEEGRFHSRQALPDGLVPGGRPVRVRLDLETEKARLAIDGKPVAELAVAANPVQRIGFRGGLRPVAIDNIEIAAGKGEGLSESFSGPAQSHLLAAGVGLALVGLSLALFLVLSRYVADSGRRLSFAFLMANLTLLVCASLLYAFVRVRVNWYPGQREVLEQSEVFYRKGMQDRVVEELLARLEGFKGARARRILFVGSSQTWGAGARRDEEAFVRQLETRLNEPFRKPRFICLNLGVSAAKARDLVPLVRAIVPLVKPGLVVINLSSNDRASRGFDSQIRKMVERAQAAGAQPVLVLEANAPGTAQGLVARHAELEALAAEMSLPLIDLHGHLLPLEDSGFLWWDKVHLTTWGQRLAADKLYQEIVPLLGDAAGREQQKSRPG